jgi:hypothetical protein
MLDGLGALLHADVESELIDSAHSNVILLRQVLALYLTCLLQCLRPRPRHSRRRVGFTGIACLEHAYPLVADVHRGGEVAPNAQTRHLSSGTQVSVPAKPAANA